MKNYLLKGFRKSKAKNKKYDAILLNEKTGNIKHIPFGDKRYEQYKDTTGLKIWSHLDHLDEKRRKSYKARHKNDNLDEYSPGYFSYYYLW